RTRRDNVIAGIEQTADGEELGRLPAAGGQSADAAFERGHPLLEYPGGGVHDACINVAERLQVEQRRRMLGVFENIRRGLINRHGASVACHIRLMAGVQRAGAESVDAISFIWHRSYRGLIRMCLYSIQRPFWWACSMILPGSRFSRSWYSTTFSPLMRTRQFFAWTTIC